MEVQQYIAIFDGGSTTVNGAPPKYGSYHKHCNKVPCTLQTASFATQQAYVTTLPLVL